jgi:uncharacterized membrane protein (DUF2068 family)
VKPHPELRPAALGLSLIVLWKIARGAFLLLIALLIGAAFPSGRAVALAQRAADWLAANASSTLLKELSAWLTAHLNAYTLGATTVLVGIDGALAMVQGVGLHYRRRWAAWLTVITTSLLIPFEVVHFARQPHWSRLFIIAANLAIVIFLAIRVRRAGVWRDQGPSSPAGGTL